MRNWGSIFKGLALGTVTGICVGLSGFFLANVPAARGMGPVMFLLVPFCAGFAIAMVTRRTDTAWAGALLATLISLVILVAFKKEGILCALLAFPLLGIGLALGAISGSYFRRHVVERLRNQVGGMMIILALTPGVIFVGHHAEMPSFASARIETVSNSIYLHATPEEVWSGIQSIDSINASKPALMYVGLPVPLRCTLERKAAGAKRTCYFENGSIQEIITEWSPPRLMR